MGLPLYCYRGKEAFLNAMPRFDHWGLLPEGHEGPRDNPFLVVPGPGGPGAAGALSMVMRDLVNSPWRTDPQRTCTFGGANDAALLEAAPTNPEALEGASGSQMVDAGP